MTGRAPRAERRAELLAQLADFSQYPPESNLRDADCYLCLVHVPAGAGVVALGSSVNGGTFAVTLHKGCADAVDVRNTAAETDEWMFGPADAEPAGTPEFEQALAASVAHLPRD